MMVRVIALATGLTAGVLALLVYLDLDAEVRRLLEWIGTREEAGLLFVLVMALVVLLLVPGVLFTTGAGFLFGPVAGTAYVVVGTTTGAAAAFLIARHALGSRARRWLRGHARVRALSAGVAAQGWKAVLLTRLIPFFPAKAANYAFGLTEVRFGEYVLGTFVGIIPFSLHNAYLGSLAADLVKLGQRPGERGALEWGLLGAGLVLLAGGLIVLGRMARRALDRYPELEER